MSTRPLAPFFEPESVAVVGASRDPSKVGGSVLANLRAAGFAGRVVPINARAEAVQGLAAAPSILAVEGPIDLAVIAVPAPAVLPALKECVAKGVSGAVVITAGFGESGREGWAREAELRAWLRDQPLRVLGPNCLGWIRPSRHLNMTFAPGMPLGARRNRWASARVTARIRSHPAPPPQFAIRREEVIRKAAKRPRR